MNALLGLIIVMMMQYVQIQSEVLIAHVRMVLLEMEFCVKADFFLKKLFFFL